jgi:hypothetical protein
VLSPSDKKVGLLRLRSESPSDYARGGGILLLISYLLISCASRSGEGS